jgi:hypothetical protein
LSVANIEDTHECFCDSEDSNFDSGDDEFVVSDVAVVGTIAYTCSKQTDRIVRCTWEDMSNYAG